MPEAITTAPKRAVSEFNFLDPHVQDDPFEYYAALQEQAPVHFMPETGMYIVTRYDDLRKVLLDPETYSNNMDGYGMLQGENWKVHQEMLAERGWPDYSTLNFTDPPHHTRYRRIADQIFNARRIAETGPRIDALCHEVIDSFIDKGECELVSAFAFPFVGSVISEQLGLDGAKRETFKKWGDAIMEPTARILTVDELRRNAVSIIEMQHFIADRLEERRQAPRNDLISALVQAKGDDGEGLSMVELQSFMRQFLSGTYESLVTLISHSLWLLLRFPDQMQKLRANRDLMKDFIEEALRFDTPVPGLARYVTRDTELNGVAIPQGAIVMTRYAAANRDPAKFACPHLFDIERKDKTHLAFGTGPHICVGRLLARREMTSAFTAILDRMDDIALARPLPSPVHVPHVLLRPMRELHISFRKTA